MTIENSLVSLLRRRKIIVIMCGPVRVCRCGRVYVLCVCMCGRVYVLCVCACVCVCVGVCVCGRAYVLCVCVCVGVCMCMCVCFVNMYTGLNLIKTSLMHSSSVLLHLNPLYMFRMQLGSILRTINM